MNWVKEEWQEAELQELGDYLNEIKEEKYRKFNQKFIKSKYLMLGIRIPILRKMAKTIGKGNYQSFLKLPVDIYEIVMLKALVVSQIKTREELDIYWDDLINLIDNWAVCDILASSLKIVKKNKEYFIVKIKELIDTKEEYKVRLGLVLLLNYYEEEEYLEEIFKLVNLSESSYYYVNMARAWLLCETFINFEEKTLTFLKQGRIDKFTLRMTITKIKDSFRLTDAQKKQLECIK